MWWESTASAAAVGIIITSRDKVFLIQEKEEKLHLGKLAGMLSFPMETREKGESCEETLARLLQEEAPGLEKHLTVEEEPSGFYQVVRDIWLLVYWADISEPRLPMGTFHGDVQNPHWAPLSEAMNLNLRRGAKEALFDRIERKRQIVRNHCEEPQACRELKARV
jgi:8-oxo-dGTP pyrophosphatase MutT (NUDIX family)